MKHMTVVFVSLLLCAALGCKHQDSGGAKQPAASSDCEKAIANGMALAKGDMAGDDAATLAKMHDLGVQHCHDDKWSDAAIACMVGAKSETDAQGCYGQLTADQRDKMNSSVSASTGSGSASGSGSDIEPQ